jgi:transposase
VRLRAASQAQVASAFGVDPATVWRWDQALAAGGMAGLVPARKGPRRASKLTGEMVRGSPDWTRLARHHATARPAGRKRWGSSTWTGTPASTRRTWPG